MVLVKNCEASISMKFGSISNSLTTAHSAEKTVQHLLWKPKELLYIIKGIFMYTISEILQIVRLGSDRLRILKH